MSWYVFFVCLFYCFIWMYRFLWVALLIINPCSNAIAAMTFANYILQSLYPTCSPPENAIRLIAAIIISKFQKFRIMIYHIVNETKNCQFIKFQYHIILNYVKRFWNLMHPISYDKKWTKICLANQEKKFVCFFTF